MRSRSQPARGTPQIWRRELILGGPYKIAKFALATWLTNAARSVNSPPYSMPVRFFAANRRSV